jgi:hypothetical protein
LSTAHHRLSFPDLDRSRDHDPDHDTDNDSDPDPDTDPDTDPDPDPDRDLDPEHDSDPDPDTDPDPDHFASRPRILAFLSARLTRRRGANAPFRPYFPLRNASIH